MSTDARCPVAGCGLACAPGRDTCARHSREHLRAAGRRSGEKRRQDRAAQAAALTAATVAELRAALEAAMRAAFADGDWSTVVSAVRAGIELLKTGELEAEVRRMLATLEGRRGPEGDDDGTRH